MTFHRTLTRLGGVVRRTGTGEIVSLLKEVSSPVNVISGFSSFAGVLNLGISILNLGVSIIGFAIVLNRLRSIEEELRATKEILLRSNEQISQKIDLSFYANFSAALTLAMNAFRMEEVENRRMSAMQAINRFLEAEEIYFNHARSILEAKARGAEQYLLTLALAYIAEVRCYLELEEIGTAYHRHQETITVFRPLVETYIRLLLTSKPCVYLHPELHNETDLTRLTKIIRWLEQDLTISDNQVFQRHRQDIYKLYRENENWKASLPDIVWQHIEFKGFPGTFKQLPNLLEKMESMIETYHRLEAYGQEIQAIQKLGMSFREWTQISALPKEGTEAEILYILPSQPIKIA